MWKLIWISFFHDLDGTVLSIVKYGPRYIINGLMEQIIKILLLS